MPGEFGVDACLDAECRIGAAVEVLREQRHAFGMLLEVGIDRLELLGGDRVVAVPPHVLVGDGVADGELVLRAAAGEFAGIGAERAVGGQHRFCVCQRVRDELRRAEIPMHRLELRQSEFVGAEGSVMHARLLHRYSSSNPLYRARLAARRAVVANIAIRPRSRDLIVATRRIARRADKLG